MEPALIATLAAAVPLLAACAAVVRGARVHGTRIVIETTSAHAGGLQLRGESTDVRKLLGAGELDTGDGVFDRCFFIGGLPASTFAFLDAEARGLLLDLRTAARVEIAGGEMRNEGGGQ